MLCPVHKCAEECCYGDTVGQRWRKEVFGTENINRVTSDVKEEGETKSHVDRQHYGVDGNNVI